MEVTKMGNMPWDEICALDKILVKDNKYIGSITVIPGYYGIGGSNRSGFQGDWDSAVEYTAEALDGSEPIRVMGWEICALINDVLYLRYKKDDGEVNVVSVDRRKGEQIYLGDEVAYDTMYAKKVKLNRK